MRLESFLFGDKLAYQRMADVLSYTAEKYCFVPLSIHRVDTEMDPFRTFHRRHQYFLIDNAIKTRLHCETIQQAQDGELIGLLDSDLMILHDVSEIETHMDNMDFAYTVRPGNWPFNSGVVFVKVSDKTRRWYKIWLENVQLLMCNTVLRKRYETRYGRINQSGLGMMLETDHDLNILQLPCHTWNCVPQTYSDFDPTTTKIVHILGKLRELCTMGRKMGGTPSIRELTKVWSNFEKEMKGAVK